MCCPGCQAAAATIIEFGLADYYRHRVAFAPKPAAADAARLAVYDDPALLERFALTQGALHKAVLTIGGMRCSACAWLLESRLRKLAGVLSFDVDFAARRARLVWDRSVSHLATILGAIETLGYAARPFSVDARREQQRAEESQLLRELGVALIFGMQVMMIAFAFYTGDAGGFDEGQHRFLRWISLLLTLPVLLYSSRAFYHGAWRALRQRTVNMDVPIVLAISLAFAGSLINTVLDVGQVYFDSVVMFVTLLTASRYLELRARVLAGADLDSFSALMPDAACRIAKDAGQERFETIPVVRLVAGDRILVRPGETLPADGVIESGDGGIDEAILTGEAEPRLRGPGARVLAGSVNLESPLRIVVTAVSGASFAGYIANLIAHAASQRPALSALGHVAAWFVYAVLLTSIATAWYWLTVDPSRWFAATLAVLVVSCPCALAIAVPAALASANGCLLRRSIAVVSSDALDRLAQATHFVFDKTGTLTDGHLSLRAVVPVPPASCEELLAVAVALAHGSDHPIARALRALPLAATTAHAEDCHGISGRGLTGTIAGKPALLGSAAFICTHLPCCSSSASTDGKEVWVAYDGRILGHIEFDETLRPESAQLMRWLRARGYRSLIMSGDRTATAAALGARCGVDASHGDLAPAAKLACVAALQDAGAVVVMTGDGLNDAPVLARADVSIAVADASAAARQQADVLLLKADLNGIRVAASVAKFTRTVMRQNLLWAATYNLASVPLAAAGLIPPWLAALGMSLSSLIVVTNALRIRIHFADDKDANEKDV